MATWIAALAAVGVSGFGSCGQDAKVAAAAAVAASVQAPPAKSLAEIQREETQAKIRATLQRLQGRWRATFAEDWVFGENGLLLLDGLGPFDRTCTFEVTAPDRILIHGPPGERDVAATLYFFENKVRVTAPDGFGGRWDGLTLTRN